MLVFVHNHKTGGNTFSHILRSSYGLRHCQVEPWHDRWFGPPFSSDDLKRVRRLYPNLKSIAGHRVTAYIQLQENETDLEYFTLIRDPIKLCASRFQYKVNVSKKDNLDFQEWIQREWTRNHQTKMIAGAANADEAIRMIQVKDIFVGLTEYFDESMVMLKALRVNDLNISYKPVNVARDKSVAKSLLETESTRQMLIEAQTEDLKLYNFVKQELYPTYQRQYGPALETDVAQYQKTKGDYNHLNLTLCRLKHYTLYNPLLFLHRSRNSDVVIKQEPSL